MPPADADEWKEFIRDIRPGLGERLRPLLRGHPAAIEDVIQDSLLAAYVNAAGFRGDCPFAHFVHRVARNKALHFLERSENRRTSPLAEDREVISPLDDPLTTLIDKTQRSWIAEQRNQLKPRLRQVIDLYLEGKSYEDISRLTGIPVNTLKSYVRRITGQLRDARADGET